MFRVKLNKKGRKFLIFAPVDYFFTSKFPCIKLVAVWIRNDSNFYQAKFEKLSVKKHFFPKISTYRKKIAWNVKHWDHPVPSAPCIGDRGQSRVSNSEWPNATGPLSTDRQRVAGSVYQQYGCLSEEFRLPALDLIQTLEL